MLTETHGLPSEFPQRRRGTAHGTPLRRALQRMPLCNPGLRSQWGRGHSSSGTVTPRRGGWGVSHHSGGCIGAGVTPQQGSQQSGGSCYGGGHSRAGVTAEQRSHHSEGHAGTWYPAASRWCFPTALQEGSRRAAEGTASDWRQRCRSDLLWNGAGALNPLGTWTEEP